MSELYDLISTTSVPEQEECSAIVAKRQDQLDALILYCKGKNMPRTATYLENARDDLFTCLIARMGNKTTSKIERIMRTINMRINVGVWSQKGALNVNKIRLAFYYNGFLKYYQVP